MCPEASARGLVARVGRWIRETANVRDWVALILPGRGYTALGAALRFPALALEAAGARSVVVEYADAARVVRHLGVGGAEEDGAVAEFHRAVRSNVDAAIEHARRVTVVAKSLGTVALAHLHAEAFQGSETDAIWITPLFPLPEVRRGAVSVGLRSLLVAGTADSAHHGEFHEEVRSALSADSLLLAGADHSLEVPGLPLESVARLRELTDAVVSFSS